MDYEELREFKEVAKLDFATFFLNHDQDILMVKYHQNTTIDLEKAMLTVETVYPFISNGAIYGLTDATESHLVITQEARHYYKDNKSMQLSMAHAVVVKELSVRLMANFFAKFDKPITTTKVFNNFQSALSWLENQKLKMAN